MSAWQVPLRAFMRIVLVHPNYHSGGAEIAGKLAAGMGGLSCRASLKKAGYTTTSRSSMR
jgi:hypothetical protein